MNVAVIRRRYNSHGGGAERYAARLVRELVRAGDHVTVFAETFEPLPGQGVEWHRVPRSRVCLSSTTGFHRSVRKVMDLGAFDVVLSLCRMYPSDICRVTEQIHSEWLALGYGPLARFNPRHRAILRLERDVYSPGNSSILVTNSELVKRQIVSRFGFPADRIHAIRNGVDPATFSPARGHEKRDAREALGIPGEAHAFLFAADNFAIKGLQFAIDAIAGMDDSHGTVRLVIVGGDDPKPYVRQAERAGCRGRVLFLGRHRDMRPCYVAADALVHPTLYEPCANVCLEAMACGIPVVTTALNGAAELIEHASNGYVVQRASDVEQLRLHLSDLVRAPPERQAAMGRSALDAARECTWENHIERLLVLLRGVRKR